MVPNIFGETLWFMGVHGAQAYLIFKSFVLIFLPFQVAEQLKFDLNHVLTTKIDFINNPVYHDNIILEDNIRSDWFEYSFHLVPPTSSLSYLQLRYCCDTGQTFGGLLEYMKNCNILKIVTHVKFVFSRFEGFSFTHASIMMIFSRMNLGTVVVNPTIGLIRWGQYDENTSPCILCIIFTPAIDTSE